MPVIIHGLAKYSLRIYIADRKRVGNTPIMEIGDVTFPDCVEPCMVGFTIDKIQWEDGFVICNRGFTSKVRGLIPTIPSPRQAFAQVLSAIRMPSSRRSATILVVLWMPSDALRG